MRRSRRRRRNYPRDPPPVWFCPRSPGPHRRTRKRRCRGPDPQHAHAPECAVPAAARLRPGRVVLAGEDRAIAEWEISWALTRAGITSLWCLDADNANPLAWRWLRDTAEREDLRLVLHTTTVPDTATGAALTGCRVRTLSPQQLRGASRPSVPEWRRPPQRSEAIGGTDTPSRG